MGNTISGAPAGGLPPSIQMAAPGQGARPARNRAVPEASSQGTAQAVARSAIFSDAARQAGQGRAAAPRVLAGTQEAARQPARFTVATNWENPANLSPDISRVPAGRLPPELRAMSPSEAFGLGHSLFELEVGRTANTVAAALAAAPKGQVVPIPQAHLEKAVAIAASLAADNTVHLQNAAGTYLVQTGESTGDVRDLSTMIIGFTPRPDVSFSDLDEAGQQISRLLRQESVLAELDSPDGAAPGATLVARIALDPGRTADEESAVIRAFSARFGGTTKVSADSLAVIVDTSGSAGRAQDATEATERIIGEHKGISGYDFKRCDAGFSRGVRIENPAASRTRFIEAIRREHAERVGEAGTDQARARKMKSLTARAAVAFDDTWQRLFGSGLRPAAQHYVMIDQKSRHLAHEDAPMHWSARAVSLNDDRTEIRSLWTSELVLDTSPGRTLAPDPLVGRAEFAPGTALVKDVGLASPSYAPLGTYVVPVRDAEAAITQMKAAETESTSRQVKYHTEVPNCLSYALGLLKTAQPAEGRHLTALEDVFRSQAAIDARIGADSAADIRATTANLGDGDRFSGNIKGLVTGDTNYPRALVFLERIADDTLTHPGLATWEKAFNDHRQSERYAELLAETAVSLRCNESDVPAAERMEIANEVRAFMATNQPTPDDVLAYRARVVDDFNAGLRFEASGDPATQGGNPVLRLRDDGSATGAPSHVKPTLADLYGELPVHDLARLPRRNSAPGALGQQPAATPARLPE
jgi:hypothetical protein